MDGMVLARFLQEQMDAHGWRQRDLAERSGLSRQVVSTLLRDPLRRMVEPATIAGLAQAFTLEPGVILLKSAEAIGVPVHSVLTAVRPPTNDELVELLRARLVTSGTLTAPNPDGTDNVAGQGGEMVSGEAGTSGDFRDPRRQSRGSETLDERPAPEHAHPHLL